MTLNMHKERPNWLDHDIIGYVPLDEDGKPYRPHKSGYPWMKKNMTNPPRIYTTIQRAIQYSPCGCAAEVRMFTVDKGMK